MRFEISDFEKIESTPMNEHQPDETPEPHTPNHQPDLTGNETERQRRRPSLARSASIVSLAVMSSRVLGLVREMIFAYFFGASKSFANDAFVIAFRIPNLLRDLFAEGALSSAFVPVFSSHLVNKGERAAFRLSNLVATALIILLGAIVLLGIIFAPQLVAAIAHGFQNDPEKFALTVRLTRIMMPFILLVALAAQAMGVLNSRDRFAIPALSSTFFNIGSIAGGVLFAIFLVDPTFTDPARSIIDNPTDGIIGMAYGVLIGGFLQLAIQVPSLHKEGFRYRPELSFTDSGMRQIFKLMGPAILGSAAVQINVLINSNFASSIVNPATGVIDNGPVSWLSYAFRLMQFPIGVFGVAIATATLPAVSRSAALREIDDFRHTIAGSMRVAFLMTIPSAVGLAVLSRPIIALIYERGGFTSIDTDHTAGALTFYAIGLAGYAAIKILAPAFYALGDARSPMIFSILSIATNFLLNWSLRDVLQERGLALATSISSLMNMALLYFTLSRRIQGIEGRRTAATVGKILIASAAMAAVSLASSLGIESALDSGFIARAINVSASVAAGAVVFYFAAYLLNVEELKAATAAVKRRLLKRS